MNKNTIKINLLSILRKMGGNIVTVIILTLIATATVWVYGAFTEPAVGPASSDQDFTQNILGANNADNDFDSSSVVANADGSIVEILEDIRGAFTCGTSTVTFKYRGGSVTYGTVLSSTGECWLDRNLGATQVATSSTDSAAYGDLFQWGRLSDNHEDRASGITATNSSIDNPYHSNFITETVDPDDWRVPQNNNLWQGVNGINNPCPDGWRIPTETELNAERVSWTGGNNSAGAFSSLLKLPAAGSHDGDGSLRGVGSYGYYWSSTVSGTYARCLHFWSTSAGVYTFYRARGFSVRCLKD